MNKLLLLVALTISSQSFSQSLDSMLQEYSDRVPDQKIHVHFDKDIYTTGETVWFKAYFFSGFNLSVLSKNFYAELINDKGNIVQRKVYPISEATASGNMDLTDTLAAGSYVFRGYTTWMLNFDTGFLFRKIITITDATGKLQKVETGEVRDTKLQFFPEGGNLLASLENVVAFKANDDRGMPVYVKGNIVDAKGTIVSSFAAAHDGMGSFVFTPKAGESYKANWTDAKGKNYTTDIPEIRPEGVVLKMTNAGQSQLFSISRTANVPDEWKQVTIVALLGQQLVYKAKADLTTTLSTGGAIPTNSLPSGIMQVTLLNHKNEPLAERIVMVNNSDYLFPVTVNTPVLNTIARAKNTIEIEVSDTLLANMSIAVTDAAIGTYKQADNIVSRALLTGDIKGYVHQPAYYFSNKSDSVAKHLDLVLLTHGWRKYNWPQLSAGKLPRSKFTLDKYLSIDAKVFGITPYSQLRRDEELMVFLQARDSSKQYFEVPKTGADKFSLPNVFFWDTVNLYYDFAVDRKSGNGLTVAFDNGFYKGPRRVNLGDSDLQLYFDTSLLSRTKVFAQRMARFSGKSAGKELQTVVVKAKMKSRVRELEEKYVSSMYQTDNGETFDLTDANAAISSDIFTFLKGRVAGLQIKGYGGSSQITWRGATPALYVNEMVADPQTLSTVPVSDIALVKVIRPPFLMGGSSSSGGAILVYTKKGEKQKSSQLPGEGMKKTKLIGYSFSKEFYSPDYKDLAAMNDAPADYRTTLYWNPKIITDQSKQKVRVDFYNNDITKAFRIVLEGVNEAGKVARIERVVQQQNNK